jgi:hypothetical protein
VVGEAAKLKQKGQREKFAQKRTMPKKMDDWLRNKKPFIHSATASLFGTDAKPTESVSSKKLDFV